MFISNWFTTASRVRNSSIKMSQIDLYTSGCRQTSMNPEMMLHHRQEYRSEWWRSHRRGAQKPRSVSRVSEGGRRSADDGSAAYVRKNESIHRMPHSSWCS